MANWKKTLDVRKEWKAMSDATGPAKLEAIKANAPKIVAKLNALYPAAHKGPELVNILTRLRKVKSVRGFDRIWNDLYNWGDQDHRLFVMFF